MNSIKKDKNGDKSIHILLVDDDPLLLDTTKQFLEVLGYIVTSASGSSEAIALMKSFIFDVLITDYSMPGMNGVELAMEANKLLAETPIILCTGKIASVEGNQRAEARIAAIVNKPCRMRDID